MAWFTQWWTGLGTLGQVLACFAIPGSLLLVIQTIMLIAGGVFGNDGGSDTDFEHDLDHDFDHDFDIDHDTAFDHGFDGSSDTHDIGFVHDMDHDSSDGNGDTPSEHGLRLFTVRGLVAFFAVGGWVGLAVWDFSRMPAFTLLSAITAGFLALLFAALVIKWAMKLQEDGNISTHNAIGLAATVYIPIPPNRTNTGRVTLTLQERFVELEACTDAQEKIQTGETVLVVGSVGGTLIVSPMSDITNDVYSIK